MCKQTDMNSDSDQNVKIKSEARGDEKVQRKKIRWESSHDDKEESYICKKKRVWSHEETMALIHETTKFPFFRLNTANVVDGNIRAKAYMKIARKMGVTVDEMKRKFRSLQINYTTVKRERAGKDQPITWPYYELMDQFNQATTTPDEVKRCIDKHFTVKTKDMAIGTSPDLLASLDLALQVIEEPLDEYDVFGEYVASEFRKLPTEEQKQRLKRLILRDLLDITDFE